MAIVAEVVKLLLDLDQKSEVVFIKRKDSPYVFVVGFTLDGQKVAAELPTAVEKEGTCQQES